MYFKLISESLFNRRLRETVEDDNKVNQQMFNKLKNTTDYAQFVNYLTAAVEQDKKANTFLKFLQDYYGDGDVLTTLKSANASKGNIPIKDLHPTQDEIDVNKSLSKPLKDAALADKILEGNGVVIHGPIITFKETYIIDGHHRWSQVYALNPEATMQSIDFAPEGNFTWSDCLKAIQIAIAANTGSVPSASVEKGNNLLDWSAQQVKDEVMKIISDDVVEVFAKHGKGKTKEEVADYIAENVKVMQTHAQKAEGASSRDFMPQTDPSTITFASKNGLIDVTG